LPDLAGPALVIYEDKKMPKLIQREQFGEIVVLATTRALLAFAEERGLIMSAEEAWNDIIKQAMSASPSRDGAAPDARVLAILQRYAAGEISARQAAREIGPKASEHDVFAGIIAAHLTLPEPSSADIAREVAPLRDLYGPHGPRLRS
jgi:hypothetical protein